jgi:DNA repair exonuclease SbcCD ATPase subunit
MMIMGNTDTKKDSVELIKLISENVKKLKAVQIEFRDGVTYITGKNGAGKSCAIDSIWFALGGKDSLKDTPRPIREGAESASATVDLGSYIVTRSWTSNEKSYLKVENKEGAKYSSPQALLDTFRGDLSFDPLQFSRLDAGQQKKTLLMLLNIEEKLAGLDAKYSEIYSERTYIGRNYKAAKAQFEGMEQPPIMPAEAEADIGKLTQKLEEAIENNQAIGELKQDIEENTERLTGIEEQIKRLQLEKEQIECILENSKKTLSKAKKIDTQEIQERIAQAQEFQRAWERSRDYKAKKAEVVKLEKEVRAKTAELEKINEAKNDIFKTAKMPIEGLGVTSEGVTYNELPLSQLALSEQIKVSMHIAIAQNPKLKCIFIRDGSLLDSDSKKYIEKVAKEKDYKIIVEQVDESGKVGVYIEDGEVKANNYEKGE